MTVSQLIQTYSSLPESLQKEIDHYVEFIAQKVAPLELEVPEPPQENEKKVRGGYGVLKGKIRMSDDFDAPLDGLKDYM